MTIVVGPVLPGAEDLDGPDRRSRTSCSPARRCATRSRSRTSATPTPSNVVLRDAVPANTTYVAGSTTLNGVAGRGCRRPVAARERHADQLAGESDAGFDACRRVEQPGQRRDHHVRRGREPDCRRRHGDLEPGLRHRRQQRTSSTSPPTTRTRRSPTIRRATSSATCPCSMPRRASRCRRSGLAGHRRSGRRAALHDHRAEFRGDRRDGRRADRRAFRRTRPTSRIPRCSTDCRSASRTAASRRSPRASTSARPI